MRLVRDNWNVWGFVLWGLFVLSACAIPNVSSTPTAHPIVLPTPTLDATGDARAIERQELNGYVITRWEVGETGFVTIAWAGETLVTIDFATNFHPLSGEDINGDGAPDTIIETYTGGANCCYATVAYSLVDFTPEIILKSPVSSCPGTFTTLDEDASLEYLRCDSRFAYAYCPLDALPVLQVVDTLIDGMYQPANTRFPSIHADRVPEHTRRAAQSLTAPGSFGEWDGTNKCGVLPLLLDYIYMGETTAAWNALHQYYKFDDRVEFWADIFTILNEPQPDYLPYPIYP